MINGNIPTRFGVSRAYTKFIVGFVVLTIILVFIIFYFSFSNALIKVTPKVTTVSTDFIADIDIETSDLAAQVLPGTLFETEVELTESYQSTGAKDLEGDVIGTVIVYNDRSASQPLVATTRLLTADNILLRLKNRIDVPANGKIEAQVYADDPSSFETLAPTDFSIPGLSESMQKLVYAKSTTTLSSKPGSVKVIKAVDIARAKENLSEKIYQQATENFQTEFTEDYIAVVVAKKIVSEEVNAEVDQVADSFDVSQKIKVSIMGISQQDIIDLAVERLNQFVSNDMELSRIKLENLSYVVQNYNEEEKTANIKMHAEGDAVLKETSSILDKNKLSGLSARGVELYLTSFDEIDSVAVDLSPFWVKKVPKLQDHITIEIINVPKLTNNVE